MFSTQPLSSVVTEESQWNQPVTLELFLTFDSLFSKQYISVFLHFSVSFDLAASTTFTKCTQRRTAWWRLLEVSCNTFVFFGLISDFICCSRNNHCSVFKVLFHFIVNPHFPLLRFDV